jgi:hypothetical protein
MPDFDGSQVKKRSPGPDQLTQPLPEMKEAAFFFPGIDSHRALLKMGGFKSSAIGGKVEFVSADFGNEFLKLG